MEEPRSSSTWWPLAGWVAASIPATGIAGGAMMLLHDRLYGDGGGFFSLGSDPWLAFVIGAVVGMAWAGLLAVPHLLLLRLWVALVRALGDVDTSRVRILVAMIACSLPQAVAVGFSGGWSGFAAAWIAVAFGLWAPRAAFKRLRPGVFNAQAHGGLNVTT